MSETNNIISRRQFLGTALGASAALMGLPSLLQAGKQAKMPNFIVILIDDLGYQDLGCFGSELIKTPRIDQMASEGMKLTSFYAQPVCTPSRAALMTGCYPMRVSLPNVLGSGASIGISSNEITLAQLLKTKGYATACVGKWHLGSKPQFLPTRHGFDSYFGIPYSNDMGTVKNGQPPLPLMRDEKIIEAPVDQETLTERYTTEAVKFITENRDKPFFLYLPHTYVHTPLHPAKRFAGTSQRGKYGDEVECLDWSTGEILDTLKKLGLDDNTLVVFTSDNGPWLIKGQDGGSALPLREGKGTTYEGGVRVPCIARWPGHIPSGTICSEMVSEMDVLPTLAKLAGTQAPTDRIIDGKDIWPLMSGKPNSKTPHNALFYYHAARLEAVRSGKWKLVLEIPDKKKPTALYDLEADIGETTDLSASYPKVVKRLADLADQCREDLGDSITNRTGRNCRPCGVAHK